MKTIDFFRIVTNVVRHIVQGIVTYCWNIYKSFRFIRMCSIVKKWPEEIKLPYVIAVIDKE